VLNIGDRTPLSDGWKKKYIEMFGSFTEPFDCQRWVHKRCGVKGSLCTAINSFLCSVGLCPTDSEVKSTVDIGDGTNGKVVDEFCCPGEKNQAKTSLILPMGLIGILELLTAFLPLRDRYNCNSVAQSGVLMEVCGLGVVAITSRPSGWRC